MNEFRIKYICSAWKEENEHYTVSKEFDQRLGINTEKMKKEKKSASDSKVATKEQY